MPKKTATKKPPATKKSPAKKSPAKKSATKKAATKKPAKKKAGKKASKKPRPTLADRADKFALYQRSVQSPPVDIAFFDAQFQKLRGRQPLSVREDFCGTFLFAVEWCKS